MSASQLLYGWDFSRTGRTKHVWNLKTGEPACKRFVVRCSVRRHVHHALVCPKCYAAAERINKGDDTP